MAWSSEGFFVMEDRGRRLTCTRPITLLKFSALRKAWLLTPRLCEEWKDFGLISSHMVIFLLCFS